MANKKTINPPSKKLQEFCRQHNISWEELDKVLAQCEPFELNGLNEGNFGESQKILNKYLL